MSDSRCYRSWLVIFGISITGNREATAVYQFLRIFRRGQFGQTLWISHHLGPLTVAGELGHFTQPLTNGNAIGNFWAVSYPVRKNLVVDAGFDHRFTSSSTTEQ
jgi:hypothetical protein